MIRILITVDVEDWFQVENFKPWIPFSSWAERELRVEQNVSRLLDLFDQFLPHSIHATFFILGWIARRLPHLVRAIYGRGHEVASHGLDHELCPALSPSALSRDLADSKALLEDIIGAPVFGYRAPSFSISKPVLETIREAGYRYDSSYNSFGLHGRYGRMDFSGNGHGGIALRLGEDFFELPVSNLQWFGKTIPMGGGGYFRMMPFALFQKGVEAILKKNDAYLFYMHPWEIDPDQPRVTQASASFRFRHYLNLHRTEKRLCRMIRHFAHCRFISCRQYLEEVMGHG